jgi:hypothetical protein
MDRRGLREELKQRQLRGGGGGGRRIIHGCVLDGGFDVRRVHVRLPEPVDRHARVALRSKPADVDIVDLRSTVPAPPVERCAVEALVATRFTRHCDMQVRAEPPAVALACQQRAVAIAGCFDAMPAARPPLSRVVHSVLLSSGLACGAGRGKWDLQHRCEQRELDGLGARELREFEQRLRHVDDIGNDEGEWEDVHG